VIVVVDEMSRYKASNLLFRRIIMCKRLTIFLLAGAFLLSVDVAYCDVLDILSNVKTNYQNIGDVDGIADIYYTDYEVCDDEDWNEDYDDATLKSAETDYKVRLEASGTDERKVVSDGTDVWVQKISGSDYYCQDSTISVKERLNDWAWLVDNNTWSFADPSTESVNGIPCWHLNSTDYDMWVDTATDTKVIKVNYNSGQETNYMLFETYSYLESKAYMYDTATHYKGNGTEVVDYSTIDIDASLPSSTWELP